MNNLKLIFANGGRGSGNFGHKGRPGQVGGSAKGSGGSQLPLEVEYAYYIAHHESGDQLPQHLQEFDNKFIMPDKYKNYGEWAKATLTKWSRDLTIDQSQGILTKADRSKLNLIARLEGGIDFPYQTFIEQPKDIALDADLKEWGYDKHALRPAGMKAMGWWDAPTDESPYWKIHVAHVEGIDIRHTWWHEFSHTISDSTVARIAGKGNYARSGDLRNAFADKMVRE